LVIIIIIISDRGSSELIGFCL